MLLDLPGDLLADHVLPVVDARDLARLRCTCTTLRSAVVSSFSKAPCTYLMEFTDVVMAFITDPCADVNDMIKRVREREAQSPPTDSIAKFMWIDKLEAWAPEYAIPAHIAYGAELTVPNFTVIFCDPGQPFDIKSIHPGRTFEASFTRVHGGPQPIVYVQVHNYRKGHDIDAMKLTYSASPDGGYHITSTARFDPFITVDVV
jgi:hypothetical protein